VLNPGTSMKLLFFLFFIAVSFGAIRAFQRGWKVPIRRLAALDGIVEAVGRATELGRPFFANITAQGAYIEDQILASCELIRFAADAAVKYQAPFIVVSNSPDGHPIFEEIVHSSYVNGGKSDLYKESMVRFVGGSSSGTHIQIMQMMKDERIAGQLISGNLQNQTMFYAETGAALGAIQIGATRNTHQMPFLAMQCDYALMGDDLYAAAAQISEDPQRMGFLTGQEFGKAACLVVLIIGLISNLSGSQAFLKFLSQ